MLDVGEGPKAKSVKSGNFKNIHILHKIDFPEKFYEKFQKFYAIFGFYASNYLKISHKINRLGMTLHFNIAPKLATQISKFQFWRSDPTICIPIDRAHQTEQLLWRHLMVVYYGMCDTASWSGHRHKNTIIFKNL